MQSVFTSEGKDGSKIRKGKEILLLGKLTFSATMFIYLFLIMKASGAKDDTNKET